MDVVKNIIGKRIRIKKDANSRNQYVVPVGGDTAGAIPIAESVNQAFYVVPSTETPSLSQKQEYLKNLVNSPLPDTITKNPKRKWLGLLNEER